MLKNVFLISLFLIFSCKENKSTFKVQETFEENLEPYRPQFHFTPSEKWMNDPNGLVYHQGLYHLFYQYYPDDIVWGPMHWGHATSKDMLYWDRKPIALYPDKNGYIFSGSAVIDINNTSGFGSKETPALVAIFTYHDMDGEKAGRTDFQTQGIAYSLDNGESFNVYEANPVIKNNGIKDFRDPKVFWDDKTENWNMLLVAGDHLQIWQSKNLKDWQKVSEFGRNQGAHGGVWECPDLFPLKITETEEEKWVLLISINPGAPNGGSGTQYFVGDFDGTTFTSSQKEEKWLDWGTDNYAGVTYNNAPGNKRIFLGWMSNWAYARDTPTEKWRSAMTIPRELSLTKTRGVYELVNYPLEGLQKELQEVKDVNVASNYKYTLAGFAINQSEIVFKTAERDFILHFTNPKGERLKLSLNKKENMMVLDRSQSGKVAFQEDFASIQKMPIANLPEGEIEFKILIDWSSIEIFVNKGQYVMTAQIFPNENYNSVIIENTLDESINFKEFKISKVESIW